jgi:hypothetical protein
MDQCARPGKKENYSIVARRKKPSWFQRLSRTIIFQGITLSAPFVAEQRQFMVSTP